MYPTAIAANSAFYCFNNMNFALEDWITMRKHLLKRPLITCVAAISIVAFADACAAADSQANPGEAAFLAQNDAAMNKMMKGMAVAPSGDVDKDFVAMMVPHHQGAIEMAQAVLRYGHNEQLRRIAQEIIVDQQQEIAAMRLALGQPLPPSYAAPTERGQTDPHPAPAPAPSAQPASDHHMHM